jgi:hypothetical protein
LFFNFFSFKHSIGGFFTHFHKEIENQVKLILSVRGTMLSAYSVGAELSLAYSEYYLNIVPRTLSVLPQLLDLSPQIILEF